VLNEPVIAKCMRTKTLPNREEMSSYAPEMSLMKVKFNLETQRAHIPVTL
jgi:hypothetical protein